MARRKSAGDGGTVRTSIEGLEELSRLPGWIDRGQRRFVERSGERIAEAIAERAPGGKGGSVGRATRSRTLSSTKAEIVVDHPGAKALERGAFIKPKRHTKLRFTVGGRTVFPRFVRLKGRGYAAKGLRARRKIVNSEYAKAFDDLSKFDSGGGR